MQELQHKKYYTWLILEDQPDSVTDVIDGLQKTGHAFKIFVNPGELIEYLITEKKYGVDLNKYALMLDNLIIGTQYIVVPKILTGSEDIYIGTTNRKGYDAGLLFCEHIVFNKDNIIKNLLWQTPPPIIFSTVIEPNNEITNRLNNIKALWNELHNNKGGVAKVDWIVKWDSVGRILSSVNNFEQTN